jgi:hypothetical protein
VAAGLLVGALFRWPYSYFTFLRWVTCASAAYAAFVAHQAERLSWVWAFGIAAMLFNPLVPVRLPREVWRPIDVAMALLFVSAAAWMWRLDGPRKRLPPAPRQ